MKVKVNMKRILIILAIAFIGFTGVMFYLATWKENFMIVKSIPASVTISKVATLEKTGGSLELKSEDINGLIETLFRKGITASGLTVTKMFVQINKDVINIYAPANFKGINLLLSCNGTLAYKDSKIIFTPDSFTLGKITLPKFLVMGKVSKFSSEDISISTDNILIDKNAIPFEMTDMGIKEDTISVAIAKVTVPVQPTDNNSNTASGGSTGAKATSKEDILKKANSQLSGVYRDVKSFNNKNIVTRIQGTVSKMIADPSYNYSKDVEEVKAMKNKLTQGEKDELQDAILDNMSTATIKQIRNTFGI